MQAICIFVSLTVAPVKGNWNATAHRHSRQICASKLPDDFLGNFTPQTNDFCFLDKKKGHVHLGKIKEDLARNPMAHCFNILSELRKNVILGQ